MPDHRQTRVPTLSIGLPVYNGARFIEQTLDSLLTQTYTDFELIISDNGSTDRTEDICRRYAGADQRIRYVRHAVNRGATFNWNFVISQARGEYFKWASASDYCAPRFIEACMDILRANDDVVLCYTRTFLLREDEANKELDPQDIAVHDDQPAERFLRMMRHHARNNAQAGIIRRRALAKTRLNRPYPHSDRVLMAEIAAQGKFHVVDEPLLYRRFNRETSSAQALDKRQLREFLAPERNGFLAHFEMWSQQIDFLYTSLRLPIPVRERLRLSLRVARRVWWRRVEMLREVQHYFRSS